LTPGDYLYLDCGSGNKYGNTTWCGEYKTWKKIYEFPIFNDYKNFSILGSQVVLFGEIADDNSIVGKIFPRASSLSEILWRNQDRNSKLFFLKLIHQNRRLKERDISTVSFTTLLCENEPQECLNKIV
jgi:hexosaminidase